MVTYRERTTQIGYGASFFLIVASCIAAYGYDTEASSRQGRGIEGAWHGVLAMIGEGDVSGWRIWIARTLAVAGLALVAWYAVRVSRGDRSTPAAVVPADRPPAPQQTLSPASPPEARSEPRAPSEPESLPPNWPRG